MAKRKIVEIDDEKCNGCGECIPQCHENALQIIDGKARLAADVYCDGLGACLGACPRDAIRIIEREADPFDEEAVRKHQREKTAPLAHGGGCPGAAAFEINAAAARQPQPAGKTDSTPGALSQWPVQLQLVPVNAPYFEGADLLLAADCVPFAFADFHSELLAGRKLLIGCPKLDDGNFYRDKLKDIIKTNNLRSLTVVHMEVPCCHALLAIARRAVEEAGVDLDINVRVVSVGGKISVDIFTATGISKQSPQVTA